MATETMEPRDKIAAVMADLGLEVVAEFVPLSRSRNRGDKYPSLNWRVTVTKDGRDVATTDYSAGMAHCPGYVQTWVRDVVSEKVCAWECEHGHPGRWTDLWGVVPIPGGEPITPDPVNVLWSLTQDLDALDCPTYEDWADMYGYDPDSRTGEAVYRQCLELALKLHAAVGDAGLARLREAGESY